MAVVGRARPRSALLDLAPGSGGVLDAEILAIWDFGEACLFDNGTGRVVSSKIRPLVGRLAR